MVILTDWPTTTRELMDDSTTDGIALLTATLVLFGEKAVTVGMSAVLIVELGVGSALDAGLTMLTAETLLDGPTAEGGAFMEMLAGLRTVDPAAA